MSQCSTGNPRFKKPMLNISPVSWCKQHTTQTNKQKRGQKNKQTNKKIYTSLCLAALSAFLPFFVYLMFFSLAFSSGPFPFHLWNHTVRRLLYNRYCVILALLSFPCGLRTCFLFNRAVHPSCVFQSIAFSQTELSCNSEETVSGCEDWLIVAISTKVPRTFHWFGFYFILFYPPHISLYFW